MRARAFESAPNLVSSFEIKLSAEYKFRVRLTLNSVFRIK